MLDLPLTHKALAFAAQKHAGQVRIGVPSVPYLAHLVSVALRVSPYDTGELLVVGALLHDTLEDTETTFAELQEQFSPDVATLVRSVSEDKSLSWRARKELYLEGLLRAGDAALLVALADKVDNLSDRLTGIELQGSAFLARWREPQSEQVWFFEAARDVAQARLPEHPLTKELSALCERARAMLQQL